jgi:hypothetical protein
MYESENKICPIKPQPKLVIPLCHRAKRRVTHRKLFDILSGGNIENIKCKMCTITDTRYLEFDLINEADAKPGST